MGIAYLRHSLTLALAGALVIGSTIIITTPLRNGITPDAVNVIQLVTQTISATALIIMGVLALGLGLNTITTGIFMGFHQEMMDEVELYILIPRYLFTYNLIVMPILLIIYLSMVALPNTLVLCLAFNAVAVGFVAGDVARQAWENVADWYQATLNPPNMGKSKHDLDVLDPLIDYLAKDDDLDDYPAKRKHIR